MLGLEKLARSEGASPEIAGSLWKLRDSVEDLSSELHALSANLHPPALERVGLVGALRGLLGDLAAAGGPHFALQTWEAA